MADSAAPTPPNPNRIQQLSTATASNSTTLAQSDAAAVARPGWVSPQLAAVLGVVSVVATAAAAIVPQPFGAIVGILGFCGAALSGLSLPGLSWASQKPIVGPAAVTAIGSVAGVGEALAQTLPPNSWQQALAYGGAAVAAWLAGKAAPQLKR